MAEYNYNGSKRPGDETTRLVVRATEEDQEDLVAVVGGGPVELSDEQVKSLRDKGHKFTKVGESDTSDDNPSSEPETQAQQQRAQVASGAQHAAATPENDNTPAGRSASGSKK